MDESVLPEAVPAPVPGVLDEGNVVGPVAGGERSGCAARLSCDAVRGRGMPDRPMDPEGKSPSRLAIPWTWGQRCGVRYPDEGFYFESESPVKRSLLDHPAVFSSDSQNTAKTVVNELASPTRLEAWFLLCRLPNVEAQYVGGEIGKCPPDIA